MIFKGLRTKHWGKFNKVKWATGNVCHQSIFYPKAIYSTHNYNIRYKIFADYAYNLNLLKEKVAFCYIDLITVLYDEEGSSSKINDSFFEEKYRSLVINSVGLIPYYCGLCIRKMMIVKKKVLLKF